MDLLVIRTERFQDEFAQAILCGGILNRAQQRKATPLTVGGELPRRERDVLPGPVPSRPDGEADQLQAIEARRR